MITIIRHAKVNYCYAKYYFHHEFNKACLEYNNSHILQDKASLCNINANKVYVSSLKRTRDTAKLLFPDAEHIEYNLFDEVPIKAFAALSFPIPTALWFIVGRLQWMFGFQRQPESIRQTISRAMQAADILESEKEQVSLVCHGLFMRVLVHELKKRGYHPDNVASYRNLGIVQLYKR